jgi:hypothetical protein
MSDVISKNRAAALARSAQAMLRALGGGGVAVRFPAAPAENAGNAELGIDGPVTQDYMITPVVARAAADSRLEFLFSPDSLAACLDERGESGEDFFASALGIVQGEKLLPIESVATESFAGTPYLYHVVAAES